MYVDITSVDYDLLDVVLHDARYVARGNAEHAYEAGIKQRMVIVEFESVAKAVEAHDSADYQAALKVFDNCAERDLRIVEGLE